MNVGENIKTAFRSLAVNKVRSFLTMLGIIIGISAFILVNSVGAGAQSLILDQINKIGSNLIIVTPGAGEDDAPPAMILGINITTLKRADIEAIERNITSIEAAAPYVRGSDILTYEGESQSFAFFGTTPSYLKVQETEVASGRFFTEDEERSSRRVVVLGHEVATELFGDEDPVGKKVRLNSGNYNIIGVMKKRGATGFINFDTSFFIPLSTAQKVVLGIRYLNIAHIKVTNSSDVPYAIEEIETLLRERHGIGPQEGSDFQINSTEQALGILTSVTDALKLFLAAIAAMSLLVGGVGIMNIMYVSVSERTYEIGLRKSVGATYKRILTQFLTEAIIVTVIGGVAGIIVGVVFSGLIALGVTLAGFSWTFIVPLPSIFLSFIISAAIGLFFGIYPARRAAKQTPVEALRANA